MTQRQAQPLAFISAYIAEHSFSPSYEEMRVALGVASKSGVHRLMVALQADRKIRRRPHHARSIEVIGMLTTSASSSNFDPAQIANSIVKRVAERRRQGETVTLDVLRDLIIEELS